MNKIYQKHVCSEKGDCMQAVIATLFNDKYENVPSFIEHNDWFELFIKYVDSKGYKFDGMLHNIKWGTLQSPTFECFNELAFADWGILSKDNVAELDGVDGLFFCSVLSPKYFSWEDKDNAHAVICDKDLNIIHDPNMDYKNILSYPLSSIIGNNGIISLCKISKKK